MTSLPSLNALRAFDALARVGTLNGAASTLDVSPDAIKQHVYALNRYMGVDLFEKIGRELRLTAAGESLARDLGPAFRGIEEAVALVRGPPLAETVKLNAPTILAKEWIIPRLGGFDGAEVELILDDNRGRTGMAPAGADLTVAWGRRPGGFGPAELLGEEEVFPVCSPALGRRVAGAGGLAGVPLLHHSDIPPAWEWPGWPEFLERTGLDGAEAGRDIRLDGALMMDAARAGQGLALVNTSLAHDDLAAGRLARPLGASLALATGYWLIAPAGPVRPEAAAFRDWLLTEYAACFGLRAGPLAGPPRHGGQA